MSTLAKNAAKKRWDTSDRRERRARADALLDRAERVAKAQWARCEWDHAHMTRWLMAEYQEDGAVPFADATLPEKRLRSRMLALARKLNKPTLGTPRQNPHP